MNTVDISIIIPVYNVAGYLERCLQSILCQDFVSYEVILVDDGSTDESVAICDDYAEKDARFKAFHKKNGGVSSARNAGIELAKGRYVVFVDSDDALTEGALQSMMSAAGTSDVDFVTGGFNIYDDESLSMTMAPSGTAVYSDMNLFLEENLMDEGQFFRGPWAKMYRRNILVDNGLRFDESLSYAEDKLFVYSFLNYADSAAAIGSPVYDYFRRNGTLSGGKTTERRAAQLLDVVPLISKAMVALMHKYPGCKALRKVYRKDLVKCDAMRVLRYFVKHRTSLCTLQALKSMYKVIFHD